MGILDRFWERVIRRAKDIDSWRKFHMAFAEWVDAWRLVPRALVIGYAWITWHMVQWYMDLEPYMIDGCDVEKLGESCIVNAPTVEHMGMITAILGVAAAVFGLYTGTGRKWNGFTNWNKHPEQEKIEKPEEHSGE